MRDSILIQGMSFNVHSPYQAGHALTEEEAGVLNQTFHENLRNNFAGTVKQYKDEYGEDPSTWGADARKKLEEEFEEYRADYKFGVRRGGARAPADPIEAEAFKMVKEAIREKLKQMSKTASAADISEAASQLLASDKGSSYRKAAERRVAEAQRIASESLSDVVAGLSAPTDGGGEAQVQRQPAA